MRGATANSKTAAAASAFQSTLPMRGATGIRVPIGVVKSISIHAPHAGSDNLSFPDCSNLDDFNPRSPCGERLGNKLYNLVIPDFNPRSPCGERPVRARGCLPGESISIHAPHAGSDIGLQEMPLPAEFQSTLPMRGATNFVNSWLGEP